MLYHWCAIFKGGKMGGGGVMLLSCVAFDRVCLVEARAKA